jgi:hypothetical protein
MFAACIGGLGGCALYSPARDKQAQEAAKAWHDVDLNVQVAIPRKNMAALFAQQLNLEDELALAARDNRARAIATGGTVDAVLIKPVDTQLNLLAGSADQAAAWAAARKAEARARRRITDAQRQLRWLGLEAPDCATLAGPGAASFGDDWAGTPAQAGILSGTLKEMTEACNVPAVHAVENTTPGGVLGATRDRVARAKTELEKRRAAGLVQRNNFRAAQAKYDAAAAALDPDPVTRQEKLREIAGRLKAAADALAQLDDAFSVQFLSEQKRDALNTALTTILDRPEGAAPPADANRVTVALAVFPELLDKANQAFADARKPTLLPLLVQKNLEQIKADAARRDVDAQLAKIALLDQVLETQSRQADRLLAARAELQGAAGTEVAATALGAASPPTEKKMRLWRATAYFLDATGRLSADAGKLDYRLLALEHERALAYSESSILQWRTLIDSNVAQMVEFGASGIKAEHVTALLNSASLLAIAIGTNK